MTFANETQITPPRVSLIDERTGAVSREWYRWFYSLYNILGAGTGVIPVDSGGTGLGTIPTNGQLLIGNGTNYTLNTLGYGVGISVTNGAGTIVVANTGVLSNIAGTGISVSGATGNVTIGNTGVLSIIAGTGISASSTTGNVTLSNTGVLSWSGGSTGLTPATATTGAVTLGGLLAIGYGGTNGTATPTTGAVAYGTGTAYAFTAAGTSGQVLTSAGAGTPTWTTPTTGTVTSVGLAMPTQFTVTNSPVTSSGTLTAAWTTQSANVLLAGPASGAGAVPTFRALTTADIPALPYGSGTVTSVGLSLPSIITVTNSPVTTSGTLTGTLTTQAVNAIFAGPSSGAAAAPTFRSLTTADIPTLAYGSVTSVSFTGGIVSVATPTTTPALTVAGTSGGIPYFSSGTTWASSAALAANALVIGGGAGVAPSTTTTGTGVVTALSVNTGTAGAFVVNGGALGTPSSGTVTNLTGTASININGTVGATTTNTGSFTSLAYSTTLTGGTGIVNLGSGQFYKDASGNIGVGTTSPSYPVVVSRADTTSTIGGSSASMHILNTDSAAYGRLSELVFNLVNQASGSALAAISGQYATYGGSYGGNLLFSTNPGSGGSVAERLRITSDGLVGIGTTTPSASALLDVQSTTKGVRMPNMTTTQKNAISSPAAGLMVFDTTLAKLCVYSGAAWQTITSI